jgi:4-hydroxy-4-methyl-2-oxoglutarate aldolase
VVGEPVVLGGVTVNPGDIVVGDVDGVVVVPLARAEVVADRLDKVKVAEAEMDAKVAAGLGVSARITELIESGKVRFLD